MTLPYILVQVLHHLKPSRKGSADRDWLQDLQGEVLWPYLFFFFAKSENHSNFYQGLVNISDVINDAKPVRAEEFPMVQEKNLTQGYNIRDFVFNVKTDSWLV